MQLLRTAGHPHRPRLVAEVALQLAFDRDGRVRGELEVAIGIEALDRLEHAEVRDLQEVVERLAAVRVATREVRRERLVRLDQFVAELAVAGSSVLDELRPRFCALLARRAPSQISGRRVTHEKQT